MNGLITRGFENGIITRGFGRFVEAITKYYAVPVCEPSIVSHEYGKRYLRAKELKPIMATETPPYYYEEIEE